MSLAISPYLRAVLANAASDLHLKPGSPPRLRVSGTLVAMREEPLGIDEVAEMVLPTMSDNQAEIFAKANEVDYAIAVPRIGRFRVNVYRSRGEIAAVLRHITDQPLTLAELGMPDALVKMALEPRGLILVTGPTGSGKTT